MRLILKSNRFSTKFSSFVSNNDIRVENNCIRCAGTFLFSAVVFWLHTVRLNKQIRMSFQTSLFYGLFVVEKLNCL